MKTDLYYIEQITGSNRDGPAWIGYINRSKTGHTVYFNNKAYHKIAPASYVDIETNEQYWISRVKLNGKDRHRTGHGKIMIDRKSLNEYLRIRKLDSLKSSQYTIIDIVETRRPGDFYEMENMKLDK